MNRKMSKLTRTRPKELRLAELIAVALGGMIGGGIFAILGISVEQIGNTTPIAIFIGGGLAFFAAYAYVKLALLYQDEGATYSFFKKTFPHSPRAASIIGWLIVFGYISTLALYAFTFASYFCSQFAFLNHPWGNKLVAGLIISIFAIVNLVSVKGMGRIEDVLVYTKIIILLFISGLLFGEGDIQNALPILESGTTLPDILIVSAITFVAYEGFQLVIHAYDEMETPQKNIPRAIYGSITIATLFYIALAVAALSVIPKADLIANKEYALAAGAAEFLGKWGHAIVILGALLATSSAISGTLFGASRLMAVIARDGYLPAPLARKRKFYIPANAIILMSLMAFILVLSGTLQVILEFGSITFILVSFLMAYANFVRRDQTNTPYLLAILTMGGLLVAGILIFIFEWQENREQLFFILGIYALLAVGAVLYSRKKKAAAP